MQGNEKPRLATAKTRALKRAINTKAKLLPTFSFYPKFVTLILLFFFFSTVLPIHQLSITDVHHFFPSFWPTFFIVRLSSDIMLMNAFVLRARIWRIFSGCSLIKLSLATFHCVICARSFSWLNGILEVCNANYV